MGNLFLINSSFETINVPETNRDRLLVDFLKAIDKAHRSRDHIHATEDIHTFQYSYGNFFYELLYEKWETIQSKPSLAGISSTTINLYHAIAMQIPSLVKVISSVQEFLQFFDQTHFGYAGFKLATSYTPYVSCEVTYDEWKRDWLMIHQNEINWQKVADDFLPNKLMVDEILWTEIVKHRKENEVIKHNGDKTIAFYEEVMRKKGSETAAYTIEIGTKILSWNYYEYLPELSQNERRAAGDSFRNVFSIIGRRGQRQYISLDHRHGMFEYHDDQGSHLGEFKFDGSFNSPADSSHNLKTLKG